MSTKTCVTGNKLILHKALHRGLDSPLDEALDHVDAVVLGAQCLDVLLDKRPHPRILAKVL